MGVTLACKQEREIESNLHHLMSPKHSRTSAVINQLINLFIYVHCKTKTHAKRNRKTKQNEKKEKTVLQCGTGVQDYRAFALVENWEKVQLNS